MAKQTTNQAQEAAKKAKQIEKRWTKPLADVGWTAIPNIILEKQSVLGLKPTDVNVTLQILKHWWEAGSHPYPSVGTIAKAIGVQPRTVQRSVERMEALGLLQREARYYSQGGQKSNGYNFQGLIDKSTPFAEEALKQRADKQKAEQARRRRRTPLYPVK